MFVSDSPLLYRLGRGGIIAVFPVFFILQKMAPAAPIPIRSITTTAIPALAPMAPPEDPVPAKYIGKLSGNGTVDLGYLRHVR